MYSELVKHLVSWVSSVGSPDAPYLLLHSVKCFGGPINPLVLWLAVGFCQWGAPIGSCRKKGWSGHSIYSPGSSWPCDSWLGAYLEVTASLKIVLHAQRSFQLFTTSPSPHPFRPRGDSTLAVTGSSIFTISCGFLNLYSQILIRSSCFKSVKLSSNIPNLNV